MPVPGAAVPDAGWAGRPAREPAPLAWARRCYGYVILGGRRAVVRAVRVRSGVRFTTVAVDDPVFAADRARGVPVVSCLSSRESFVRWIEAPLAAVAKARRILPTLLDIQLPFALEDCIYCFLRVGRTRRQTTRALAVAARRGDLQRRLDELIADKVSPHTLDQEGLAIWTQSLAEWPPAGGGEEAIRLVAHLGESHGTLAIGRGVELGAVHTIRGTVTAGAIGRVLRAEIRSAGTGAGTGEAGPVPAGVACFWAGPGARDEKAVAALHAPLAAEWPGPSRVHDEPEPFLARAVAARALLPGDLRCNLRQGEWTHPAERRRQFRRTSRTLAGLLVSGLLLCAASLAVEGRASARLTALDRSFGGLRDRLMGHAFPAKGRKAIEKVREKIQKDTRNLRPFARLAEPQLAEHLVAIVTRCRENGLRLDRLSLGVDGVSISGTAADWKACEALTGYLTQAGYTVSLDRRPMDGDGRVPFVVATGGANE